ncbi:uncharacterized protein LOC130401991 [Gadus chalcogrammus]|uniref:uncharacterized protein LOC130401991 n=1 Tax=Gadus chalcogrammus TaxID=1042646 RepID=UPI0024C4A20D|nr:uncharacterized protein LOC130401991 [Gadus chalcogrammus]
MSRAELSETRASAGLSPSGHRGASPREDKQDTPWTNAFSVVSRPALSLLHKYLPGLLHTRSLTDSVPDWVVEENLNPGSEVPCLRSLGDLKQSPERVPPPGDAGRLLQPGGHGNLMWMTEESLSELGIKDGGDREHIKDFFRNRGPVLLNATSSAEAPGSLLQSDWRGHTWWGEFWGTDLSKLSLGRGEGLCAAHCSLPAVGTKATVAQTTALFVPFIWESMASENAGHSRNTQQAEDNGSLESPQPETLKCSEGPVQELSIKGANISTGSAAAFGEVAVLTPEQDNGYSSLEEGHVLCQLHTAGSTAELQVEGHTAIEEPETSEPAMGPSPTADRVEEEGAGEGTCDIGGSKEDGSGDTPPQDGSSAAADTLSSPCCQNRAIAFIMGSPCSDDEDTADSLSGSEASDRDDGFDSEGSSEISESDSEDSNSDNGVDSEADRLWDSLCRPRDPYNLHHFTAPTTTAPWPVPSSGAAVLSSDSSPDSSPDSSLARGPAPAGSLALSVALPAAQQSDSWDDSTSASEAEDTEGLLSYFTSSSDPYSPWNFQAPVRTARPRPELLTAEGGRQETKESLKRPTRSAPQGAAASSPPRYRREEAEDRLDSGFSEPVAPPNPSVTSRSGGVYKKVRFCEEVEEFVTSSREEEDRRGQWEELARDRCRFWRRCLDVEQSIAYCLEPEHRSLVFQHRQAPPAEPPSSLEPEPRSLVYQHRQAPPAEVSSLLVYQHRQAPPAEPEHRSLAYQYLQTPPAELTATTDDSNADT